MFTLQTIFGLKGILNLITGAVLCFFLAVPSNAIEVRCQKDIMVDANEIVSHDLIAVGEEIEIRGEICGELITIGREINCRGIIEDDIIAIGHEIRAEGELGDNFRSIGGKIVVDAHIKGEITAFGKTVTLRENCLVEEDVLIGGNEIEIEGILKKNLKAYGSKIKIKSKIAGDVILKADRIVLHPDTAIVGNLTYTSANRIELKDNAQVGGEITWQKPATGVWQKKLASFKGYKYRLIIKSIMILPILFIGFVLIIISPKQVYITMQSMHKSPGKSMLLGFVFFICMPVCISIIFFTIVGIPLAMIVLMLYLIALYLSTFFAGMAIATAIFGLRKKSGRGFLMLGMILGSAAAVLLSTIPIAGGFIGLVLLIFGLGGIVTSRWQTFNMAREKELV